MDHFTERRNVVLTTLEKRLEEFSTVAKKVAEIGKTVSSLSEDVSSLKRKASIQTNTEVGEKCPRMGNEPVEHAECSESDADIDNYMSQDESSSESESDSMDIFTDR